MNNIREALIVERMESRLRVVCKLVPPIRPGAAHWLNSDASESYCAECVRTARAAEMGLAAAPEKPNKYTWDYTEEDQKAVDLLHEFDDGIDGGFVTNSDSTEQCETCGCTLSYILTECGVRDEINYYREAPLCVVRDEDSYALVRLALNIWAGSPRHMVLGVAIAVNQAWRIIMARAA